MDPNLLASVMKSQAGTLTKALLEGIMNSIDAGASRVDVTLDTERFTIADNGRGFASEDDIRQWFGRFGTPHEEGDATYGRFRMGRGQLFSYAATVWSSNQFQMTVDLPRLGMKYELGRLAQPVKGCRVDGVLHEALSTSELASTLHELRRYVAFTPKPVYVNGTLFGSSPERLKTWTSEDHDAWIRVNPNADELAVYNQGVFVCAMPSWRVGTAGVVVSKRRLEVNFARNDIMENQCATWKRIRAKLERATLAKLARAGKLSDNERGFLARHLKVCAADELPELWHAKVLTEPGGKHVPLIALREARTLVYSPEASSGACLLHGGSTFVITDQVINRFGEYSFEGFVERLRMMPGVLRPDFDIQDAKSILAEKGLGERVDVQASDLTPRQQAASAALEELNDLVGSRLTAAGRTDGTRKLLIARQKKATAAAWTDGKTYITFDVRQFKEFEVGLDGVQRLVYTLVHEYMHDTDDSESHDHGEVFFRKFHDTLFDANFNTGALAQQGLLAYLAALKTQGVARSRRLSSQLDTTMPR